jgi:hypothetical protein
LLTSKDVNLYLTDASVLVDEFFPWLEAADQLDADGVFSALVFR